MRMPAQGSWPSGHENGRATPFPMLSSDVLRFPALFGGSRQDVPLTLAH